MSVPICRGLNIQSPCKHDAYQPSGHRHSGAASSQGGSDPIETVNYSVVGEGYSSTYTTEERSQQGKVAQVPSKRTGLIVSLLYRFIRMLYF